MATYKGIKGYTVQKLSSDPTVEDTVGQVWYNSASNVLKISIQNVTPVAAWSAGGSLLNNKQGPGGCGIQGAALCAGGWEDSQLTQTEKYNGTSWTEVNDLNSANSYSGCFGVETAARNAMGQGGSENESYDGTSWSEEANASAGRNGPGGVGTINAGRCYGGSPSSVNNEAWNGTSWSEENNLNTGREHIGACGTEATALAVAGSPPNTSAICEEWNGTSWCEVNNINRGRTSTSGSGLTTAGIVMGGDWNPPFVTLADQTETWDGTSWTETADLTYARTHTGSSQNAPSTSTLLFGGNMAPSGSPYNTVCEEFSDPAYSTKTITSS